MILVRVARATRDSEKRDEAPIDPTVENVISTVGAESVPRTNGFTCCACQMQQPESLKVDIEILKTENSECMKMKHPVLSDHMNSHARTGE